MANLIQERFDMETKELERRQARYQVKQVHISKEEEEEYKAVTIKVLCKK